MLILARPAGRWSFPVMKALALDSKNCCRTRQLVFTSLGVMIPFGAPTVDAAVAAPHRRKNFTARMGAGTGLALFGTGGILFQMGGLAYTAASTSASTQGYTVSIPLWVMLTTRRRPSLKIF